MFKNVLSMLSVGLVVTSISFTQATSADSIVIGEQGIVLESNTGSKVVVGGERQAKSTSNVNSISINGGKAVTGKVTGDCEEGSGKVKTESRSVTGFKAIKVDGVYDLKITAGKPYSVQVTSDDNLLPFIKTDLKNDTLLISSSRSICTKSDLKIQVAMPELNALTSDGSADVDIAGVKNKKFSLNINGAGTIKADGETQQLEIKASGSVDIDTTRLKAKSVSVKMEGAGDAKVFATDTLHANIDGAGSVFYKGTPKITKEISGVGEVELLSE